MQSLRSFSRLDEAPFQRADIREAIESALTLLEYRLRERVVVVRDYDEVAELLCNPAALNQVFMQLLADAADAAGARAGARIALRTRRDGDWVEAAVEDDGEGIPEANLPRIFDAGFTTRGVGVGTGLGLAIGCQIVAEHGGEVKVRSRAGEGATFTVRLPVAGPPRAAAPPPAASARAAASGSGSGSRTS